MALEIDWLKRKLTLLRAHLREVRESLLLEKTDREELKKGHQQQEDLLLQWKDPLKLAILKAQHAKAVAELARRFISIRKDLLIRQRQEEVALQEQIDLERDNHSKGT